MVKRFIIFTICLICWANNALALSQVEAAVDQNPVVKGEYFVLTVSGDDDLAANAIDTSALKKDFIIGRTSVNRSTQIINFDSKKKTSWQILLAPKKKGIATIPPFTINGVQSQPIALQVISDANAKQKAKDVFIKAELNHQEAYVGQLLLYKVKLYLAVDLQRGTLNAPQLKNAQIKQIGDDKDSTEIYNGRRFRIIERNYGIIANKPGKLDIGNLSFEGDVLTSTRPGLGMFSFNESRPVRVTSPAETVSILPKPQNYHGQWLVSDLVVLKENWSQEKKYEVGTPITRTITLYASNTDETSLPEIHSTLPEHLKNYPEKPTRNSYTRNGNLVAELKQTEAIIPTQAGTYTFPEIKIPWWNPVLRKQQYALLPAKTIIVSGGQTNKAQPLPNLPSSTPVVIQHSAGYWPWLCALFCCLWLFSTFMWLKKTKSSTSIGDNNNNEDISFNLSRINRLKSELHSDLEQQNYGKLLTQLQSYFSHQLGKKINLTQLKELSPELSELVATIQKAQYSKHSEKIDVSLLTNALQYAELQTGKTQQNSFVDLNP